MNLFYQKDDCLQNVILALEWANFLATNIVTSKYFSESKNDLYSSPFQTRIRRMEAIDTFIPF